MSYALLPRGERYACEELNPLTPHERDVLELVAEGLSNAEIGARLYKSANTVRHHLRNLYEKLGVDNRTEAAVLVWRTRLQAVETELNDLRLGRECKGELHA